MCRIPRANKTDKSVIPNAKRTFVTAENGLTFSFEALEKTEYFNLDGTCPNWSSDLFDMMKDVSKHTELDLITGRFRTYRVHNHETAKCPSPLPAGVELKDCYQIRISTSKGGIHGVFRENVFYVIWFDPLHNMYPDDRFGGLRKVKEPETCCKERDNEILRLQQELAAAKKEASEWEQLATELINENVNLVDQT